MSRLSLRRRWCPRRPGDVDAAKAEETVLVAEEGGQRLRHRQRRSDANAAAAELLVAIIFAFVADVIAVMIDIDKRTAVAKTTANPAAPFKCRRRDSRLAAAMSCRSVNGTIDDKAKGRGGGQPADEQRIY